MYNESALTLSQQNLPEQIEFLQTCRPDIQQIVTIDNVNNPKPDYLYEIDAVAICVDGGSKTVQFKVRNEENSDLILIGKRLSGKAASGLPLGFWFYGTKYTFLPKTDLICERIGGKDIIITKEQINIIEQYIAGSDDSSDFINSIQPKYVYKDDGTKFATGDYYIFINLDVLAYMLEEAFKRSNPYLFG